MGLVVIALGAAVFLSILLAIGVKLYLHEGSMSALLSETSGQGVKMLRLQFLIFSFIGAGIYLLVVFAKGEFIPMPDVIIGMLGLSSAGYLSGKSLFVYRTIQGQNNE